MSDDESNEENIGCLELSEKAWEQVLRFYTLTYRGGNSELELRQQLEGYLVLTKTGFVGKGNYIRYMGKGLVGNNLQRGGWVVKCNKKTILVEDGRRKWRINRLDNYIFVREAANPVTSKSKNRIWAEQLLRKDDDIRKTLKINFEDE